MRGAIAHIGQRLALPLGVGLVLGLIGPFGTFDLLPVGPRLAYWLAVVSVNWLLADAILRRIQAMAGHRLPAPRLLVPLLGALAAAVPATGVVALANGLSGIGWPSNVLVLSGQVLLLLAAIALPVYAWEDLREAAAAPAGPTPHPAAPRPVPRAAAPQPDPQSSAPQREPEPQPAAGDGLARFAARLSRPLPGALLCLEMQDHYLNVHASGGSDLILCRMEDAARDLDGLGRRVHRSWWVARAAVAGVERDGQRLFLRLNDERRVPVGRSFRADLKAAGWL